ncbi:MULTISPECIES: D-aminoacyl-tRNA deacylase [Clostridium]|jgi:D-tyrosyl-tRNA(Tyr) deacylase|uniref:D-aminoacyl-tRNA deacylase n=1 Tax=Clostridium saccharoperbutylacetonicum N1-4(HMT) TaxID=931276 RepID=M1MY54_9CLOT|nr:MULTISPECIES: D-aminoacyl-tRNA deacylase [Clostridium]AGF56332.1 D-tyrosyl-tRNA(Tyr) deacylase Dtd [Clostridium saccharoperbutylacetonicum N1-4(HMT)]AQR95072.1 D-tyrosyl-tRNA(Tyr) deacylase [Clostridium saccharoperbutylacetonicum]NRT62924.1 D-tyrosyl-tRNA(Tyr) deacylase [Clostridium saccharoperbutylacetonicum]NSB26281.1 D-tyrosyl-tRNA(Tyr) deacylase [Clostridium saccharoperbutylacetonicum]NSB30919.1 D-tyrosyl-tRNA(Tyr) deacylase [Clostridium saccharoperbutylacetonicum]
MRAVVQRVTSSSVSVDGNIIGKIEMGFNVLIGISKDDTLEDLKYIKDKVINLRVFQDENDKMNLSLLDVKGEILVISQFTLYGDCRKGRRPNFMEALGGEEANKLYEEFLELLRTSGLKVECGEFGAEMKVEINNDGPVTILLDSKRNF